MLAWVVEVVVFVFCASLVGLLLVVAWVVWVSVGGVWVAGALVAGAWVGWGWEVRA